MYREGTTALFKSINQESLYLFPRYRKELIRIKLEWFDVIICYDQAIQYKLCAHRRLRFRTWALVQQVASIIAIQRAEFLNCLNFQCHTYKRNKLQCSLQFKEYFRLMNDTWQCEISGGCVKNTIRITGTTLMYLCSSSVLAFLRSRCCFVCIYDHDYWDLNGISLLTIWTLLRLFCIMSLHYLGSVWRDIWNVHFASSEIRSKMASCHVISVPCWSHFDFTAVGSKSNLDTGSSPLCSRSSNSSPCSAEPKSVTAVTIVLEQHTSFP